MMALMARLVTARKKRNEEDLFRATVVDLLTDLCKIGVGSSDKYKRPGWIDMVSEMRGDKVQAQQKEMTAEDIIQDIYNRL